MSQSLLPISAYKEEIEQTVLANQVVIVEGETGSGKTTQLPVYLFEPLAELPDSGMIGITEPRRVAATEVAKYVASQLDCTLGEEVGSQIRFDNVTSDRTRVKYMTDGILLRELPADPTLSRYSIIIVDEAHERGKNLDITLGLLKDVLKVRHDLKVVIMSATIDTSKFSEAFGCAPTISIPGRCYPIEISYHPVESSDDEFLYAKVAARHVRDIHLSMPEGDILVFMSGKDDISVCVQALEEMALPGLVVLTAHGDMSKSDLDKIFDEYPGSRKVVVGTNIIETSITVDGAKYAIDSGFIKQVGFDPETGLTTLIRVPHSRGGCDQRAGRVGRTQNGFCIRLYSEEDYLGRESYTRPEILRTELSGLVLLMKSIGIDNIEDFDFIDSPGEDAIRAACATLVRFGAITEEGELTDDGWFMAKIPIEPKLSRMLISAINNGCVDEILTIIAFISCRPVFARPLGSEIEADKIKERQFTVYSSDFLTYLKVYKRYVAQPAHDRDSWAESHYLKGNILREVCEIRKQLIRILLNAGFTISSNSDFNKIAKCVTSGLVENVCHSLGRRDHEYGSNKGPLQIFPGSALWGKEPEWFVCSQIRLSDHRTYGINCQQIRPEWLLEVAPQLCTTELRSESLRYDYEKKQYRAQERVIFEGYGEIYERKVVFNTNHERYSEIAEIFNAEKAWRKFLDEHTSWQVYPECEGDFWLGSAKSVYLKGRRGKIVAHAHPFIRVKIKYGVARYYTGYTRDEEKATCNNSYAEQVWRSRNETCLEGAESYGYSA